MKLIINKAVLQKGEGNLVICIAEVVRFYINISISFKMLLFINPEKGRLKTS